MISLHLSHISITDPPIHSTQWWPGNLWYTTQDTIISCSWSQFHGYATLISTVLVSPSHRYANALDTVISWGPLCPPHSYIDTENHYISTAYAWTTDTRICYYTGHLYMARLDTVTHCYIDSPVYMHWLSIFLLQGSWIYFYHGTLIYSCYIDHGLYVCYMHMHVCSLHD